MRRAVFLLFVFHLVGCASGGGGSGRGPSSFSADSSMMPESDSESTADGAAFAGAAMHFRKRQPSRKPTAEQNWDFYFKHCSTNGNESHFSKTSYDCTGPYY